MSKQFTTAEVAKHKSEADGMWIIIDNGVYDVTGSRDPDPQRLSKRPSLPTLC